MRDAYANVRILFPRAQDADQETIHVVGKKEEALAVRKMLEDLIKVTTGFRKMRISDNLPYFDDPRSASNPGPLAGAGGASRRHGGGGREAPQALRRPGHDDPTGGAGHLRRRHHLLPPPGHRLSDMSSWGTPTFRGSKVVPRSRGRERLLK